MESDIKQASAAHELKQEYEIKENKQNSTVYPVELRPSNPLPLDELLNSNNGSALPPQGAPDALTSSMGFWFHSSSSSSSNSSSSSLLNTVDPTTARSI